MNLGNKVKGIRINAGLSQRVFAMRIGTTQQNVSNYENGLTEPSLDCLIRIADEFSVSLDELVLGKSAGIEHCCKHARGSKAAFKENPSDNA